MKTIDISRLRILICYDPDTGYIYKNGLRVGGAADGRYRRVTIDKILLYEHRVAYAYMTGTWVEHIDHVNCDKMDNRWCNLREADKSKNGANRGINSRNSTGFKGVVFDKSRNKFLAQISHEGVHYHLGRFATAGQAHAAYAAKAIELFGEYARAA